MDTSLRIARALAVPAAVLAVAGCATHDNTSDLQLPSEVTTALEMAYNKGDIQACTDLYADDAEIISDHNSVIGKKAIGEFFKQQVSTDLLFDTDSKISVVSGNVAMEQGTYKVRNVQTGVDVEFGDYLNVWRKTNGHWKAYRSMYNVTHSPGALVSVQPDGDDDRGS